MAESLAIQLMREAARSHHRDAHIHWVRFDGATNRLPELVAAQSRRERMLDHVDEQRNDTNGPCWLIRPQERHHRQEPMVECELLADRQVELIGNEALRQVNR